MSCPKLFKIIHSSLSFLFLFSICLCGCFDPKPLEKVEISEEALMLKANVRSFDIELFNCGASVDRNCIDNLKKTYGNFFCSFIEDDLRLAACNSDSVADLLQLFIHDAQIEETHKAVMELYSAEKRNKLQESFTEVVQRWNHFFPTKPVPEIIFYCSAWNRSIATTDSVIGISLDCYLGSDHNITQKLSPDFFPAYMKENMDERYIVADAVKGFSAWNARSYYQSKDLLSELVFYGKVMYVAEALAPSISDSTLMNWTTQQWEWAVAGEEQVWKTLANEKTMYHSRPFEINKWFADGPFTSASGIPQQSAPQLGVWVGWNIVRSYMKKFPETTLEALLSETDNQRLLSAYVPGKR